MVVEADILFILHRYLFLTTSTITDISYKTIDLNYQLYSLPV